MNNKSKERNYIDEFVADCGDVLPDNVIEGFIEQMNPAYVSSQPGAFAIPGIVEDEERAIPTSDDCIRAVAHLVEEEAGGCIIVNAVPQSW
eukprot:CAMPEP_0178909720 /NCGR_PEP_ID=MMETSP0786-20121207/8690_1 /TAXON_ID=186022 /ORGANISM="Thalassionema frauenfeldii, Strain CCMP 1798" /LENGTH=90 /DNA_ID=CAMNT_0020581875 /DNA_START=102 /DNA_END=371 /DNA_ORIENTATION=-